MARSPDTVAALGWWHSARRWLSGWRLLMLLGAQVLVLALSPASYRHGRRAALARCVYEATVPMLTGFTVMAALVALVIIRIVTATALSYGLSQYALELLVRTLVLELIPLFAALFVALRYTLDAGDEARALREAANRSGLGAWLRDVVLPRTLAGLFAVLTLALVSGLVTLLLAYLSAYGFSSWGFASFTRTVGQVFNPVVALIFGLKTLAFGLAVSVIPVMDASSRRGGAGRDDLARLARLLVVVLAVEVVSLVGNYT